jgi:hypothetical protein
MGSDPHGEWLVRGHVSRITQRREDLLARDLLILLHVLKAVPGAQRGNG